MSKIWSVGGCIYQSEKNALKAAREYPSSYGVKVQVYTVTQEYTTDNFVAEFERDKQLRSVLGELTTKEIKEINYKSDVKSLIDVMYKLNFPAYYPGFISENRNRPTVVMDFIKQNKVYFLSHSKEVEYYKALIKLTGFAKLSRRKMETVYFRNSFWRSKDEDVKPAYPGADYGYRYVEQINLDESYHKAFAQARKELKNDKC